MRLTQDEQLQQHAEEGEDDEEDDEEDEEYEEDEDENEDEQQHEQEDEQQQQHEQHEQQQQQQQQQHEEQKGGPGACASAEMGTALKSSSPGLAAGSGQRVHVLPGLHVRSSREEEAGAGAVAQGARARSGARGRGRRARILGQLVIARRDLTARWGSASTPLMCCLWGACPARDHNVTT